MVNAVNTVYNYRHTAVVSLLQQGSNHTDWKTRAFEKAIKQQLKPSQLTKVVDQVYQPTL